MRFLASLLLLLPSIANAQIVRINLEPVAAGLTGPLYITNAHDATNRRFIVEQPGRVSVMQPNSAPTTMLDIRSRVLSGGERGLLGLAFHPQFASNGRFFVDYTRRDDGATVIAEYRVSTGNVEIPLLVIPQPYENHNGGMIEFGPDGYLYIAMGDGGSANDPGNRAQDITQLLGKILRIDVDHPSSPGVPYSWPSSNPFAGSGTGRGEIFAYGLRNPWRFSFDRATGLLYAGDVGQDQREEVDILTAGGNYGWRVLEGARCTNLGPAPCSTPGFVAPIIEYDHSTNGRCSITGGYVYRGALHTLPYGAYIYGDFCSGEIFMSYAGVQTLLLRSSLAISSFGEDESGELYVTDLNGAVYAITNPAGVTATSLQFNAPQHGAVSFADAGAANLMVGYARIQATSPSASGLPGGIAIFSYRQGGILVSEASVPAAPLVSSGRAYAEISGPVNTGIAIANPNSQAVTIDFHFTDANGNNFGQGSTTIGSNRQAAAFLNEPPFNASGEVHGTFTFRSALPVSAIALRLSRNARGESLLTTLPVVDFSVPQTGVPTIPQFADGGGWKTSVILVNPTDVTLSGELRLFAPSGQPSSANLNGVTTAVLPYSIAPRSAAAFQSGGAASDTQVRSVSVAAGSADAKPSAFAILQYAPDGYTVSEASVPAVGGNPAWSMFVESSENTGASSGSIQSGIAVANTEDTPADFRFELYRSDGALIGTTDSISMPAHGQAAMFLNQIPGLPRLSNSFQGILRVFALGNPSASSRVAVIGLRGRYNERGDFLFTTTSPIAEGFAANSSELLFPHFVIGGGYAMQFVLFSDKGSSGTIYFFDKSGNPLSLPLR